MNIYLVEIEDRTYDCYSWHVVITKTPKQARLLCANIARDEWSKIREKATVKKIWETADIKEKIVLSDYHAW